MDVHQKRRWLFTRWIDGHDAQRRDGHVHLRAPQARAHVGGAHGLLGASGVRLRWLRTSRAGAEASDVLGAHRQRRRRLRV